MPDWKKIKAEYIRGGTSYRSLSEKYGVSFSTLRQIAAREKWTDLKNKTRTKIDTKMSESVARNETKRVDKFQAITDKLLDKISEGIENGKYIVDAQSTRQILSALKDLREIKGVKSELDMQEQIARIDKLRKEAQVEEQNKDIRVVIESGLDEFSD